MILSDVQTPNNKPIDEAKIRQIIHEELIKNANSGTPITPRHHHDNNGSPKINQVNIIPNPTFNGTITMAQGTISGSAPNQTINWANYTIPTTSQPSSVRFYGGALNTTASPAIHAVINGECSLITGYQYQPGTSATGGVNNSVSAGTVPVPFVQGSGALIMTNGAGGTGSGAFSIIRNSQSYIAFASDSSNNIYAVARVHSYDNSQIIVQTAFATNWSLSGLWVIS